MKILHQLEMVFQTYLNRTMRIDLVLSHTPQPHQT